MRHVGQKLTLGAVGGFSRKFGLPGAADICNQNIEADNLAVIEVGDIAGLGVADVSPSGAGIARSKN